MVVRFRLSSGFPRSKGPAFLRFMAKIYTRNGDAGRTRLYSGEAVDKDAIRVEAYGTVDEASAAIGELRVRLPRDHRWQGSLHQIQIRLMEAMAWLATPSEAARKPRGRIPQAAIGTLESWIDENEAALPDRARRFLVPGGDPVAAQCHVCRTLFRRAERRVVSLHREDPVPDEVLAYLNRLSDLFFSLSRIALVEAGVDEEGWLAFPGESRQS